MRLFIGIPLDDRAREKLESFYGKLGDVKTVKKENLHVTLQFLGDMDDSLVEPIKKAIDGACENIAVFDMTMTRISAFPNTRNARIIWANIEKGRGTVTKLFKNLEQNLAQFDYKKEERAFIPHITIARARQGADISAQAAEIKFEIGSKAGKVVLFKSDLGPEGPLYSKVYEKSLTDGG